MQTELAHILTPHDDWCGMVLLGGPRFPYRMLRDEPWFRYSETKKPPTDDVVQFLSVLRFDEKAKLRNLPIK